MGGMIAIFAAEEAALLYKSLKGLLFVVRNGEAGLMLHKMREELKQVDVTMCVCVCVYTQYVCMYVCMCMYVCVHLHTNIHTHTHTNARMYLYIYLYIYYRCHISSLIFAPSFVRASLYITRRTREHICMSGTHHTTYVFSIECERY